MAEKRSDARDLGDEDSDDLREELEGRGFTVYAPGSEPPNLDSASEDELREQLQQLGPVGDLPEVFEHPRLLAWLRSVDPPQEVRDAYYQTFGRIL